MERIILFDGECNFCDSSVQFIIKRDPKGLFRYASLQSDIGRQLLGNYDVPSDLDSMVLLEDDKIFFQSTAALRISRHLTGVWKLCYLFIVVPKPFRNFVYKTIAKNRYKWFGKKNQCMIPSPEVRSRFYN